MNYQYLIKFDNHVAQLEIDENTVALLQENTSFKPRFYSTKNITDTTSETPTYHYNHFIEVKSDKDVITEKLNTDITLEENLKNALILMRKHKVIGEVSCLV